MDVDTLSMEPGEAQKKAAEYRTIKNPSEEDTRLVAIFTALAAGKQVIDWDQAIRDAGLREGTDLPLLAVGETKDPWCYLLLENSVYRNGQHQGYTTANFQARPRSRTAFTVSRMPAMKSIRTLRTQTPIVPPKCRVRGWRSMLILWEVEEWAVAPRPPGDPMLLKPLYGTLATVEAVWDLTEVERLVLGQRPA